MEPREIGVFLIVVGAVFLVAGISAIVGWSFPSILRPGKLPGDLTFRHGGSSVSLLFGTSVLLSLLLTLALAVWRR